MITPAQKTRARPSPADALVCEFDSINESTAFNPRASLNDAGLSRVQRAALELYELGFNVFPLQLASKKPFAWRALCTTRLAAPDPGREIYVRGRGYITHRDLFLELFANAGIGIVVGRTSMNLVVLDCDDMQTAARHSLEFERRGLRPWIVQTARGLHFWFLSRDGELANVKREGYEIRGNSGYVAAPEHVHPDGVIYTLVQREKQLPPMLSIAELNWLPLETVIKTRRRYARVEPGELDFPSELDFLSRRNREFVLHAAPRGERNNRLFAAACDFAANDVSQRDAESYLIPAARRAGLDAREIQNTINSAYSRDRQPAKQKLVERDAPPWVRAQAFAEQHCWRSLVSTRGTVSKHTAHRVFLALVERARRDNSNVFRASVREVAELANINRKTSTKAISALIENNYIEYIEHVDTKKCNKDTAAKTLKFTKNCCTNTPLPPHWRVGSGVFSQQFSQQHHDVFTPRALPPSAAKVWKHILERESTVTCAAAALNLNKSTVSRSLRALERAGLARKTEKKLWLGISADDDKLAEIAAQFGTRGKAQARKDKHADERATFVSLKVYRARYKNQNPPERETQITWTSYFNPHWRAKWLNHYDEAHEQSRKRIITNKKVDPLS